MTSPVLKHENISSNQGERPVSPRIVKSRAASVEPVLSATTSRAIVLSLTPPPVEEGDEEEEDEGEEEEEDEGEEGGGYEDDEEGSSSLQPAPLETIDQETFLQILDLDEDDTHDFSRGMAWAYFGQAATTFMDMDEAFAKKDLARLSSLGHFLKGSSAALGVSKVQAACEKIQHYGQLRDEEADLDLTVQVALGKIGSLLREVRVEYQAAEAWLRNWYEEHGKAPLRKPGP